MSCARTCVSLSPRTLPTERGRRFYAEPSSARSLRIQRPLREARAFGAACGLTYLVPLCRDLPSKYCTFDEFILDGAHLTDELEFRRCRIGTRLTLQSTRISGNLRLGIRGRGASIFAWDARLEAGATLWLTETSTKSTVDDFPRFTYGNGFVADSAELRIEIGPGTKARQFDFWGTTVAGRLALYGTGRDCQDGAIRLKDVVTEGGGMVGMQVELFEAQGVVKPGPENLKARVGTFTVGEWEVVEDE